ncbi:MAG TPA: nuclear transport factor 2 family protein [Actinomycetota bacterium]|nr:nuclear transport factor 2 family protein [Actinomycetota bacterium]
MANERQQANEQRIRDLFAVFMGGDVEGASHFFAEDAVFWYEGPGPIHGDWQGRDGVKAFWDAQSRGSAGGLRPELVDLVASERNAFLLVRFPRTDGGGSWHRVVVYEFDGDLIVNARVFESDPDAAVAYFSQGSGG